MDEAEQCDTLAFILNGSLIAQDAPHELKRALRGRLLEVPSGADPFATLRGIKQLAALEDAPIMGLRLRAVARQRETGAARDLLSPLGTPRETEPSLEDVFVSLARSYAEKEEKATA